MSMKEKGTKLSKRPSTLGFSQHSDEDLLQQSLSQPNLVVHTQRFFSFFFLLRHQAFEISVSPTMEEKLTSRQARPSAMFDIESAT